MIIRRRFARTLPLLLTIFIGQHAMAYQVNCSANQAVSNLFSPTQITSVFAEARPSTYTVIAPIRFHAGTDIGNFCSENNYVRPIEAGVIFTTSTACESSTVCLRVVAQSGHAFDYEHVVWNGFITNGQNVDTNTVVGQIDLKANGGNHLHLNEVVKDGTLNVRVNTQLPGRLNYSDSDTPQFSTATVGSIVNQQLIFVNHNSTVAYTLLNGVFYVNGAVDIFATARDGNNRKGLYRIGTNAYPIVSLPALLLPGTPATNFSGLNNQVFNYLQDGQSVPDDVQVVTTIFFRTRLVV